MTPRSGGALLAAAILAGAGCANTIDTSATATPDDAVASTVAFVPTGSTAELLDQLLAEAGTLGEAIVEGEGQHAVMRRIDALWTAARPDVAATAGEDLLGQFDDAVDLLRNGVTRRRPADADKATNNLRTLVAALDR